MELVRLVLSLPVGDDVGDLLGREDVGVDADIVGCEKSKSFLLAIPLNLPTQSLVNLELLWENPRDLLPLVLRGLLGVSIIWVGPAGLHNLQFYQIRYPSVVKTADTVEDCEESVRELVFFHAEIFLDGAYQFNSLFGE